MSQESKKQLKDTQISIPAGPRLGGQVIDIENLSKSFGEKLLFENLSVHIPAGAIIGIVGPNGAGKTTLIRIINHITAPDSGRVIFDGHQLSEADVAHIGYLPEERGLYKKMKVGEQAVFFARLKGLSHSEATRALKEWFDRFEIGSWWNRKVEELSKGMAQKVQFIVTVLHRPKLLIFDEPFSGFDPINANLLRDEILKLRDEGSTVIFSTHNMASVEEICSNITLINQGHNILTGAVDDIRRRFSDGRYLLTYTGDPTALMQQLEPLAGQFYPGEGSKGRYTLELLMKPDATLRQLIERANSAVELVGFNEVMASMNDIFIRTVSAAQNPTL